MWSSSRRAVLVAASVLIVGGIAVGLVQLVKQWPIKWGQPPTGELAADATGDLNAEPQRIPEILPEYSGQVEPPLDQQFVGQTEPGLLNEAPAAARQGRVLASRFEDPASTPFDGTQNAPLEADLPNRFPAFDRAHDNDIELTSNEPFRGEPERDARTSRPPELFLPANDNESFTENARPGLKSNDAEPARVFESDTPRTLNQARQFPKQQQVALLDRFQNTDPQEESPVATLTTVIDQPVPTPKKDDFEFDPPAKKPSGLFDEPAKPAPRVAARIEPEVPANIDLRKIDALIEKGDVVAAHRELSTLYWNQPDAKAALLPRLEKSANTIYFSPQPHFADPYVIQSGDKLERIAPKYQISWQYLASLNKVDPRRIQAGKKLKVIKGPFAVFVDLSDFELTVHAHGFFVKRYTVGIGKDGASPIGKFKVLEKVEKPQYTDPNGKVIAGGAPTNPLGTHWIDIGNSYGIHGTIEPDSIGKAESRGCIRMRNEEVVEVYNFLVKGSEVVIRQ